MTSIYGLPVLESALCQDVPKMQVSAEFRRLQSPALVASTNQWMREFFGLHDVIYQITDPLTGRETIVMAPRAFATLRALRASTSPF